MPSLRDQVVPLDLRLPGGVSFTYDDLLNIPVSGYRYEIVDGSLLVSPAPGLLHQRCIERLSTTLGDQCTAGSEVLPGPALWHVTAVTVIVPDVLVIRSEDAAGSADEPFRATPLVVAEVISPYSRLVDELLKRDAYERAGAPWYWIVDPEEPSVTVLRLVDGEYREHACASGDTLLTVEDPFAVSLTPSRLVAPSRLVVAPD